MKKTPEELVRQAWIQKLIEELGFPKGLLAVEKELHQLPQIASNKSLPKRRIDIVAFMRKKEGDFSLSPLLLIECKSDPLHPDFINQAISYNDYVRAPFVAIANVSEIITGHYNSLSKTFSFTPGLPSYSQLLSACNIS